ncbi:CRISPR system Cascade subunit CasD [Planctomycetes bacterium Pan216]|uniref:CRISPR system Cascade subunit CasD n=1 Tax=Kolteria novifilia TaxID=2527975 RepID=A0A518B0E9_9BACT|nr:CRISPR system Cascade subunit CasD [Planctomycetes bacterium Pan216]
MSVLLLRLVAPMQSWGTQSRFSHRDTGLEPSKSGIVGVLCAALGRSRDEPLADLGSLGMGIRVNREGRIERDFHTAGGGKLNGRDYGVAKVNGARPETVISHRDYLADADFLVALSGEDELIGRLHEAVKRPVFPLYLGRKAFVPSLPVFDPDGPRDGNDVESVLRAEPWRRPKRNPPERLRLVLEANDRLEGEVRRDHPNTFVSDRRSFALRYVRTAWIDNPSETLPAPGYEP